MARVARGASNPSLSTLEKIARKLGLEVWQLLYPGLEPGNAPVALSKREKAIYDRMRQSARDLVDQDTKVIERAAKGRTVSRLIGRYDPATLFDDGIGAHDK